MHSWHKISPKNSYRTKVEDLVYSLSLDKYKKEENTAGKNKDHTSQKKTKDRLLGSKVSEGNTGRSNEPG